MRALFVCSTGGHLSELLHWSLRLEPRPESAVWVTHDRANVDEITAVYPAADMRFVRPVEPKQAGVAAAMVPAATRIVRSVSPDVIVSTGAAVAVPFALAARVMRTRFCYLESAARIDGPSLTGRIVHRLFPAGCWGQGAIWPGWRRAGSVFDAYVATADHPRGPIRTAVVALGTQANFGFRRAAQAAAIVLSGLGSAPEITWQIGSTDVSGLDVAHPRTHIPEDELLAAFRRADVVLTHAGVGLATLALKAGRIPVLIPRRAERGEHTDDHQAQLARSLTLRGLAVSAEASSLSIDHLEQSRSWRAEPVPLAELSRLDIS